MREVTIWGGDCVTFVAERRAYRYAASIAVFLVTLLVAHGLYYWLGWPFMLPAIVGVLVISALLAGTVVALATIPAYTLAFAYSFFQPTGSFRLTDPSDWYRLSFFVAASGAIAVVSGRARRLLEMNRLRSAETKAVMDSITTGIAINDGEGRTVTMNKAAEHLLGERLPLLSLKARSLDGPPREDGIGRVLRGETLEPLTVQIDPEEPGAPPRILLLSAAPIRDGAETRGVITAFTDVTRLHEIQQEREDLLRALAHDMRAPLSSITINARVIERAAGDPELTRASARSIAENARRMDGWIEEMLEMARLAAGEMHPRPEDLPLRGVIIDMTQRLLFDRDLARIRVEVPEDARVRADPRHLERILTNLLTNAIKYSPADGPVVIRTEPEGTNVAIVVVDQGPGISMEDQARAFKRVFKGDGVGLYVTRVLAEAQGGSVSLRSTPGTRGSEFRVLLPMPKMPA